MDFQDKTVIITGASRGIGRAIARAFAEKKASLALVARSEEGLNEIADQLAPLTTKIVIYPVDVRDSQTVPQVIGKIQEDFGRVDVLVNNAGTTRDNLLLRMKEEDWDEVVEVNLKSLFLWSKAVSRLMLKQRSGCMINISSVVGLVGNAGQTNYATTKAGIIGFTKSLAKELAGRAIRINAIAPGFIETDMTKDLAGNPELEKLIPLKRMGKPEEVAHLCVFLASSQASYITGSVIQVDGGLFM